MQNKSILLVISKFPPEYSGPGVRIPRLYEWFKAQGHNFSLQVLCNGVEQTKSERYRHNDISVYRVTAGWFRKLAFFLPARIKNFLIYQIEFVQSWFALKSYKNIDFLHVVGHSGGTAAALLWAKKKKIPVLMELVNSTALPEQKFFHFFKVRPENNFKIVAISEELKEKSIRMGFEESQVWCRPNPIDDTIFKPAFNIRNELREKLTLFSKDKKIIVSVAKIMPRKNQLLILKILPHLPREYVVFLAGPLVKEGQYYERDRKYAEEMQDFVVQNKLQKRVLMLFDFVPADQFMKLADVYAMPAWDEGFGTPMLEAMACGIPVVANKDESVFQKWIKEDENGFLCDIEDFEAWAEAIKKAAAFPRNQSMDISEDIHRRAGQESIYPEYEGIIRDLMK